MDTITLKGHKAYTVGLLLIDGFPLLSYASVVEPLRAANTLADKKLYEVCNISVEDNVVQTSGGAILQTKSISDIENDFDLLLVLAGGNPFDYKNARAFHWLRRLSRFGTKLGGISGGPVILVNAKLMRNRRMTAHWEHLPALTEMSSTLLVEKSLYVIDRDRVTCAGGIAAIDLMHALIIEHHGLQFAQKVNEWLLHTGARPSDAPQKLGKIEQYGTTNLKVIQAIEIMENNIDSPIKLHQLAKILHLSPRQLNRVFQNNLTISTMTFYRQLRLNKAVNLLKSSPLSITEIALATGFINSGHFSYAFSQQYNISPSSLRARK